VKDIVIYSTRGCPYCVVAKRALDGRGIPYREVDITLTPGVRDELKAKTGEWTVPQVFVDGAYIGQDDELLELVESGALEAEAPEAPGPAGTPEAPEPGATWDAAVVGAGEAGLTVARALAEGLGSGRVLVLDRAPHMAGLDPGLNRLREAAEAAGATIREAEVFGLEPGEGDHGLVTLDDLFRARAVVVATGLADRTPALPGEAGLHGKGVSLCAACDAAFFAGLSVAVVGDDERAARAALLLAGTSREVTLLCPAPALTASGPTRERLEAAPNLRLRPGTAPTAIRGETHVTGLDTAGPEGPASLEVAGVFLYLPGDRPGTGFLHGAAETAPDGALTVSEAGETSLPGLFALGRAAADGADGIEIGARAARIAAAVARRLAPR
jgi:thioredoxin reductase (NADPH)